MIMGVAVGESCLDVGRHEGYRRLAVIGLVAVLGVSIGVASVEEAGAAPAVPAAVAQPLEAADQASAMALAYRKRRPVLVTGLTTESSRTWAQPDGTLKAEMTSSPERARASSGEWADVDLTLERKSDGSVEPRVHARGVRLSGARPAEPDSLVTLGFGDEQSALGWRGALPEPTLSGSTATYPEVKPGVDLVVEVGRTGYQYFLVAKNPQAAAGLSTISMPWRVGSGAPAAVTADERSRAAGVAGSGQSSTVVSDARMWDARVSPITGEPVHAADVV
ncbi:hypothetical protein [Plantactinospora sp. GCM10030261]|uniref:hypothetical protein n=1 Tax=Plantactinospora sp. GCM10030261 TaxID=3273420 RepID=UPI00361612E7